MRVTQPSAYLTSLAKDLIVCILKYSQPADIVTLRLTCKTMYQFTRLRIVWTNAVHSLMNRWSISESTLPVQTLPLSLLEHVALAPHRLLSLLSRFDGASVLPITTRVIPPRFTKAEKEKFGIIENSGIYDSYVELSGRYMASLSAYATFILFTIWDLGLCGNDSIKPVAQYAELAPLTLYLDGFCPGPDGAGTFYLFSTHTSTFVLPLAVLVHEVFLSQSSRISFLARLDIPSASPFVVPRVHQFPCTSKLVVHYDDDDGSKHFWIWDFLHDRMAALIASDCPYNGNESVLCYNDCIIIAWEGCLRVYNIPELLPRDSITVPVALEATVVVAPPSRIHRSSFIGHDVTPNMPAFMLNVSSSKVTFFEVASNKTLRGNLKMPNKLPLTVGSIDIAEPTLDNKVNTVLRPCEDHLLLLAFNKNQGSQSGDLIVFGSDVGRAPDHRLSKTILSSSVGRQDIKVFRFCPLLGRLCVHTHQRATHPRIGHLVYIFDYLASPKLDALSRHLETYSSI